MSCSGSRSRNRKRGVAIGWQCGNQESERWLPFVPNAQVFVEWLPSPWHCPWLYDIEGSKSGKHNLIFHLVQYISNVIGTAREFSANDWHTFFMPEIPFLSFLLRGKLLFMLQNLLKCPNNLNTSPWFCQCSVWPPTHTPAPSLIHN